MPRPGEVVGPLVPGRADAVTALGPLLADGSHRHSFGMIFEPLNPRAAERQVMRERTTRDVAVRMRQRTGQIIPEHERAATQRALHQDADRAAGHGLVRFTAYAAVTVTGPATLDDGPARQAVVTAMRKRPPALAEVSLAPYVGFPAVQEIKSNHSERTVVPVPATRFLRGGVGRGGGAAGPPSGRRCRSAVWTVDVARLAVLGAIDARARWFRRQ